MRQPEPTWSPLSASTETEEERNLRSLGLFTSACESVYRVELKYGSNSTELKNCVDFWAELHMRSFPVRA